MKSSAVFHLIQKGGGRFSEFGNTRGLKEEICKIVDQGESSNEILEALNKCIDEEKIGLGVRGDFFKNNNLERDTVKSILELLRSRLQETVRNCELSLREGASREKGGNVIHIDFKNRTKK